MASRNLLFLTVSFVSRTTNVSERRITRRLRLMAQRCDENEGNCNSIYVTCLCSVSVRV